MLIDSREMSKEQVNYLVKKLPFIDCKSYRSSVFTDTYNVFVYSLIMDFTQEVYEHKKMDLKMKTKNLRSKLMNAIDLIASGDMSPSDGRNLVGTANQINISLQTELKSMKMQHEMGKQVTDLGEMEID